MRLPPIPEHPSTPGEQTGRDEARGRQTRAQPGPDAGQIERFRALLRGGSAAQQDLPQLQHRRDEAPAAAGAADAAWLHPSLCQLRIAPEPVAASPAAASAATLAELLERQVRRLAAATAAGSRGGVLLRLSADAALPDAELLLTPAAGGWDLRIRPADAAQAQLARASVEQLQARFAARSLGHLSVEIRDDD